MLLLLIVIPLICENKIKRKMIFKESRTCFALLVYFGKRINKPTIY